MKQDRNSGRIRRALGGLAPVILAVLLVSVAAAEEQVDRKAPADRDGRVTIENVAGGVTVTGWDRAEVHVTGTLEDQVKELIFEAEGDRTLIKVVYPRNTRNTEGSYLDVKIPQGSRVEVSTVSADVEVMDVTGRVESQSVSGDVEVRGEPEEIGAETVSGTIVLDVRCRRIYVQSVSGDLDLEGIEGEMEAQTVSGEILVSGGAFERFNANSVSGDVEFRGSLVGDASLTIDAHSGDVTLELPDDVSAEFEINTFSGDIDNDFGPDGKRTSKYAPGRELEFSTGGGDARVRVNTFSGDVRLTTR